MRTWCLMFTRYGDRVEPWHKMLPMRNMQWLEALCIIRHTTSHDRRAIAFLPYPTADRTRRAQAARGLPGHRRHRPASVRQNHAGPDPGARPAHFSLEEPDTRAFAVEDPRGFLAKAQQGAILDEVDELLHAGLFPPIHDRRLDPTAWLQDYVGT
jgi:hypothetical protein